MLFRLAAAAALSLCVNVVTAQGEALVAPADLKESFKHPPDSARPWVYWFWMDGNVTKEGIAADLQAMQRVGIGGALLMDVSQGLPSGPVRFNGPEWQRLFRYAVAEATRLGLEISLHNSVGWTGSGGPWVKPEEGMQKLVTVSTNVTGPELFSSQLPSFKVNGQPWYPVAVLAYPAVAGDGGPTPGFPPKHVTVSGVLLDPAGKLFDHDLSTFVSVPAPTRRRSEYLQLEFSEAFTAANLKLRGGSHPQQFTGTLQVSEDGNKFRDVRQFVSRASALSFAFEQTKARYFRLVFTSADPGAKSLEFSEIELQPAYAIPWYQSKTGAGPMPTESRATEQSVPAEALINPAKVIDLTAQTDPNGQLKWQVPEGNWTILRLASTPTGTKTGRTRLENSGLECDKLSSEAIQSHFNHFLAPLASEVGMNTGFRSIHVDSWEIGFQNWTPFFMDELRRRRGYEPRPFLPTYSGKFVGDAQQSDRFLWDVRRTLADLVADEYGGTLAELAHQRGLNLSIEAYPSLGKAPLDPLQYAGRADVPMAEFWFGTNDLSKFDLRAMPSAAHTYGKAVVACESFTSEAVYSKWQEHPFALKPWADAAFCEGINRLVIHRYAHQPWLNRAPGMTMGEFGIHYERTQTWWEQSRSWHEYLTRCQYLLRQGRFVADVCFVMSETPFAVPPGRAQLDPTITAGYDYDLIHPELLLKSMFVKNGRFELQSGMSYQVLVLPSSQTKTPDLLLKIRELIAAGGTVVLGERPTRSPSLVNYPACDEKVKTIANELWGPIDHKPVTRRKFGEGTVCCGQSLQETLLADHLPPDFQTLDPEASLSLHWIHRRADESELYFVANCAPHPIRTGCRFRVSGKIPELWSADTGETGFAPIWHEEQDATVVDLNLDAGGSTFVVFRRSSKGTDPVVSLRLDGQPDDSAKLTFSSEGKLQVLAARPGNYAAQLRSGKRLEASVAAIPRAIDITAPWDVTFPDRSGSVTRDSFDRLVSWTTRPNAMIKYFSGTATYNGEFELPVELLKPDSDLVLSLGKVQVIAEIDLNGVDLGVLWKPPFEVNITERVKPGRNVLAVKVTNLWPNRLIGDEQLPEDCTWQRSVETDSGYPIAKWPDWLLQDKPSPTGRTTFTTWKHWHKDAALLDSGLLGPVRVKISERQPLH